MQKKIFNIAVNAALFIPAVFSGLFLIIMVGVIFQKSLPTLSIAPLSELLFSSVWQPLSGYFGFLPFIMGTIWVTLLGMVIAVPISLLCAIYLAEYAPRQIRGSVQALIDLLAGIPSVVFGLFGVLLIVPFVRDIIAPTVQEHTSGYCILSAGIVLAIMVFPILISIASEVFRMVPSEMREASLTLGATKWETVKYVVLWKAFPGMVAAIILAFARAIGETMAVLMVVGNVAKIPSSVFDPAYPLPALIANNYGEMMSIPFYDSALMFAALILLFLVAVFNIVARIVLTKIQEAV